MGSGKLPFNAPLMKMTAMPSQKWSLIQNSLAAPYADPFVIPMRAVIVITEKGRSAYLIAKLSNCAWFQPVPIPAIPFLWVSSVTLATEAPSMLAWMAEPLKARAK